MKKLLVLGVGNILMMDEGFGVHAAHRLLEEQWPETMDIMDGGTFTQDIFFLFQDYETVLVLDIVKAGKPPGTLYRLSESDLRQNRDQTLSLHDIDLLDSLGMAKLMGHAPCLRVLGVEPDTINWGTEMTPALTAVFEAFLEMTRQEIQSLVAD